MTDLEYAKAYISTKLSATQTILGAYDLSTEDTACKEYLIKHLQDIMDNAFVTNGD